MKESGRPRTIIIFLSLISAAVLTTAHSVSGFEFPADSNPSYRKVQQGQSTTATITVALSPDDTQPIVLSTGGLPSGVTCSFSPDSITPPEKNSTLTITTSPSTPAATHTITVRGGLTREFTFALTVIPPSPFNNWKAGDGHMHTTYSDGKETVAAMVGSARDSGYDWVVFTDHDSANGFQVNCGCFYGTCSKSEDDPTKCANQWKFGRDDAVSAGNVNGLSVTTGLQIGGYSSRKNTVGYYMAYNLDSFIRIEYVDSETQEPQKEFAQDIINKVNAANNNQGFGLIGYAFSDFDPGSRWDFWDVTGYSGLAIAGEPEATDKWVHDLLSLGKKPARIVNTDVGNIGVVETNAHKLLSPLNVRTYCLVKGDLTPDAVYDALRNGQVVASEGPLLIFTVKGKEIGDVVNITEDSVPLDISWKSDSTWGKLQQISASVGYYDSEQGKVVEDTSDIPISDPPSPVYEGSINYILTDLPQGKQYIRLVGVFNETIDYSAWTNPIWLTSFDFSLSSNPASGFVQQGNSITADVTATLTNGSTQPVTLSASGLPSGASASFSSNPVSPTASSTMTINTDTSTPAGTYEIVITGNGGEEVGLTSFTLTVTEVLVITTAALPAGTVGDGYSQTLQATGGVPPYTWSVSAGALPGGLSLDPDTGAITGTPTAYGTSGFTVQVADSQNPADTDTQALSITIHHSLPVFSNFRFYDLSGNQIAGDMPVDEPVRITGDYTAGSDGSGQIISQWVVTFKTDAVLAEATPGDTVFVNTKISGELTSCWLPRNILEADKIYTLKGRTQNSSGFWSGWGVLDFDTVLQSQTADGNNNGVPDDQEVTDAAIAAYGLSGCDGIDTAKIVLDSNQNEPVAVESTGSDTIAYFAALAAPETPPSGSNPYGLFTTRINVAPGAIITIVFTFPGTLPADTVWYKYDESAEPGSQWVAYPYAVVDGKTITVELQDGGRGDADGTVNGVILDPSGPVLGSGLEPGDYGDINDDGIINITDIILCLRTAIGLDAFTTSRADLNGDGRVNITDFILTLHRILGLLTGGQNAD